MYFVFEICGFSANLSIKPNKNSVLLGTLLSFAERFFLPERGDTMDLITIMREAQQAINGDYEQCAIRNA